tara:strand:+ start:2574 stop:3293 length:720 start_codon:yes stop_codon:yes gene_type:complete
MNTISSLLLEKTPKYDVTIPSTGEKTRFRPFLVKEEKILLIAQNTQSKNDIMLAIKDIIESCVESVNDASVLPIFDIEYLFVQIRSKSVGEVVDPIIICPHTGEKIECSVNLEEIELKRTESHTNSIKISDDVIVNMKYPSIRILEKFGGDIDTTNSSDFYDMILHCIDSVETKEAKESADEIGTEELSKFVDAMTKKQFDAILNFFVTSPRLEHKVNYTTNDGVDREIVLSGLGDFFG